jgi:hypothetical protein
MATVGIFQTRYERLKAGGGAGMIECEICAIILTLIGFLPLFLWICIMIFDSKKAGA